MHKEQGKNEGASLEKMIRELLDELHDSKEREKSHIEALERNVAKLSKLMLGNGEVGVCERVRMLQKTLVPLWTLVSIIGVALLTGLVKIFFG